MKYTQVLWDEKERKVMKAVVLRLVFDLGVDLHGSSLSSGTRFVSCAMCRVHLDVRCCDIAVYG